VPVLHHIAGLQRGAQAGQVRSGTAETKREGIRGGEERIGDAAAAYGNGVGAEELHGPLHEVVPRIQVHHRCGGEGTKAASRRGRAEQRTEDERKEERAEVLARLL
jgi:hypothetical protein